ncbi:7-cyano-7-deazaguanine synthase [Desulfofundulus thermocisternus]|uniref:7-cyano-7-deazaguanine synthase n=1 Tax=Desulfofundulus thermocisternus TaxID=42471 RepID=UPI00217E47AB|nr:7-cyano-7-deazaguanine synthase [Desulfofundulus thermocisternus]MCS5697337.1 7-cyano-7-deazaguanine synthase [Desulfofundulus thermocisternus]
MSEGLVLLSGGLDSSTLACNLARNGSRIEGIFVDYGQSMAIAEMRAAKFVASWAGFNLKIIKSPLDKSLAVGCLFENRPRKWETNFVSFLPQRNMFLLTIAAMYAQQKNIKNIYIGVIKTSATPFPDTTVDFFEAAQKALRKSYPGLTIHYPFINMDKASIVSLANKIGLPIDATFSCEMAADHHCMQCPSCIDRYWAMRCKIND